MIVEYIRYRLKPDTVDDFVASYERAMVPLMRSPYALSFEVTQCVEEPDCMIVRIDWTSRDDHMKGFRRSEEFKDFFVQIKPWLNNIEEMRHYERRIVSSENN